jgi:hypothetical protein
MIEIPDRFLGGYGSGILGGVPVGRDTSNRLEMKNGRNSWTGIVRILAYDFFAGCIPLLRGAYPGRLKEMANPSLKSCVARANGMHRVTRVPYIPEPVSLQMVLISRPSKKALWGAFYLMKEKRHEKKK